MTFVSGERCWREMTDDWLALLLFFKAFMLIPFHIEKSMPNLGC